MPQSSLRCHFCRKRGPVLARSLLPWKTTVFSLTEKTVVLQQSFKYFVPPKALKPYKKLQKCQKLLANLGSEDTVEPPKNYQAKVPGTVSRTKRSANFSRPQVKHFLGCKKSTKSNTCGSLFTCSGALLFSSTKTAKFQNPCISGHGAFACILYHVSTQEIHRQNLKRHRFSRHVLDNL